MNYYNPYFITMKPSLFGNLRNVFGTNSITMGNILSGTQKTLNIINQAIPIVKQMQPVMKNAKTMFKIMNEFKKNENTTQKSNNSKNNQETNNENISQQKYEEYKEGPTFFV